MSTTATPQHRPIGKWFLRTMICLGSLAVGLWLAGPAAAQSQLHEKTSLRFVPADVAAYSCILRGREMYDAVAQSRAVKLLLSQPFIQQALQELEEPKEEYEKWMKDSANVQLRDLLVEMLSEEVFLVIDRDTIDVLALMQEIQGAQQLGQMLDAMSIVTGDFATPRMNQMLLPLQMLDEERDRIRAPRIILGYKIQSPDAAEAQLARLEKLLKDAMAGEETFKDRLTREQIHGKSFLTLTLDGGMIPWDEMDLEELPEALPDEEIDLEGLFEQLKKKTLVVSLGRYQEYVLLSVGPNNDHLKQLGSGPKLIDALKLEPLRQNANRPLVSIAYGSAELAQATQLNEQDLDELKASADELVPRDIDEKLRERILADIAELADDLKPSLPTPGDALAFSFLTDRGIEGYAYGWGETPTLDTSQPLSLLKHVGGDPAIFAINRVKGGTSDYATFAKWVGKLYEYIDMAFRANIPADEIETYDRVVTQLAPLVQRMNKTTKEDLIPALKDGQVAMVIDVKDTSKAWFAMMPKSDEPLPAPGVALVLGVSDPAKLKKAVGTYFSSINEAILKINEIMPDDVPAFQLPPPTTSEVDGGEVFSYRYLTMPVGFDPKVDPNAAIGKDVAALSLLRPQSERLLKETPLRVQSPLLQDTGRKLGSAVHVDFPALVDAFAAWTRYGQKLAKEENPDDEEIDAIYAQAVDVMRAISCFGGISSVTYDEDGATVNHYELRFQDLPQD